jgi:hypothetical protein
LLEAAFVVSSLAMARRKKQVYVWVAAGVALAFLVVAAIVYAAREEILRAALDPKQPFQTYQPPPAPDYANRSAWALAPANPAHPGPADLPVDVFFVHPTTFDGGREWLGAIGQADADRFLFRVVLPNQAGPFQKVGRVFAPRYRQASLYATSMTLRDDALDARRFAYRDIRAAFETYLQNDNQGRPIILAGVGQGAKLISHLLQDVIDPDPALRQRIAAVYMLESALPAADYGPAAPLPACRQRDEARCVVAWSMVPAGKQRVAQRMLARAMVWTSDDRLGPLAGRPVLCVNPLLGAQSDAQAPAKLNRGAANATGLEWGLRPSFLHNQVGAQCRGGLLYVTAPTSPSLQPKGFWARRRKARPFNLFYADIEADAEARVEALLGRRLYGQAAPPITTRIDVAAAPIHHID